MPKVLLLGDSIRMSYQPHVARLLESEAEVVGPADNCQYSLFTQTMLDRWLHELGQPEVVHWNNGLHDCGHNPNRSPIQLPLSMYLGNLALILKRLRAATPQVVWATTTPAHPRRPFRDTEWSWRNEEIAQYNAAALTLMREEGVPVNDLHRCVWENLDAYLSADQLHLSEVGQQVCARTVVDAVSAYL